MRLGLELLDLDSENEFEIELEKILILSTV